MDFTLPDHLPALLAEMDAFIEAVQSLDSFFLDTAKLSPRPEPER